MLSNIGCMLSNIGCMLSNIGCMLSDIGCMLSDIGCMLSDIGCMLSDVGCMLSDVGCMLSDVGCMLSDIGCMLSNIGITNLTPRSSLYWEHNLSSCTKAIPRICSIRTLHYHLHEPATCLYAEPDESSPRPPILCSIGSILIQPSRNLYRIPTG